MLAPNLSTQNVSVQHWLLHAVGVPGIKVEAGNAQPGTSVPLLGPIVPAPYPLPAPGAYPAMERASPSPFYQAGAQEIQPSGFTSLPGFG